MQELLRSLTLADYEFLIGVVEGPVSLTNDLALRTALKAFEEHDTPETRAVLAQRLEHELRYLGSADLAYLARYLSGRTPGVPLETIVDDVARTLKVELPALATGRERLVALVERYATQRFAELTPEEQQRLLMELGVEEEKAVAFIKTSAGVFAVPLLVQAFNVVIVQGLIKNIVFGTIARLLGRQLAARLFGLVAARVPWWVSWIGPAAWSLSLGYTAFDLQGPAARKTVPAVLYLGLCAMREEER